MPKRRNTLRSLAIVDVPRVPLPKNLYLFTCLSLLSSFGLLILSLLDLGLLSLYINPCLSLFTLIYHTTVLVIAQRKRKSERPSYFFSVVVCAYLLCLAWGVAFIITLWIMVEWKVPYTAKALRVNNLPVTDSSQGIQCFLTALEFSLLLAIGIQGSLLLRDDGDPQWRPYEHDGTVTPFVVDTPQMLQVPQRPVLPTTRPRYQEMHPYENPFLDPINPFRDPHLPR